ncbi:MAG: M60 family metallopeptidase [Lentisphaeria bacterium]|nr:M60 family metallopeptidase [Lentisphaeria bacterium]
MRVNHQFRACERLIKAFFVQGLLTVFLLPGLVRQGLAAGSEPATDDKPPHEFFAAVTSLKDCVTGKTELDSDQINALSKTLRRGKTWLSRNRDAISACFDFVQTYEDVKGPLWIAYKDLNSKTRKPVDAIHWAAFWVMQDIVDEAYNADNLGRHGDLLDGFRFASADYFPGKAAPPEDPDAVYTVKINGSYPDTWGPPILGEDLPARKPTGAYLAPGTIAAVTVPDSLVNKGYQVRIGAHSWDLKRKPRVTRLFRVSTVYDITATTTQVASPLGGGIYIEVPRLADAGIVDVSIRNAARSPYFSWKSFHKTSNEEWVKTERGRQAPWADFQSDKFMMQVPTSWIYKLEDPVSLMTDWDAAIDVMNDLMGRPRLHGKETLYTQVDTQLRGRAFHPGYPSCNTGYDPTQDYGGTHSRHLVSGPRNAHSYEFHEMGHGFLFTKYTGDQESAVNLPHVAVFNRAFGVDLEESFRSSRGQKNTFMTLDTTAVTWMMSDHFVNQEGMANYERAYQLKGHAKYVDIVRLFDWRVLDNFWRSINQDAEDGAPWPRNVTDTDTYTLRLSKMAGADLRPLIHFWGILTQDDTASDAAIKAAGLAPSAKIYDRLVTYKSLIPKDNAAFREFAFSWWEKQPTDKGFTTERNHAARWDGYDEAQAERARQVVQGIIDRYFPEGRPEA